VQYLVVGGTVLIDQGKMLEKRLSGTGGAGAGEKQ